MNKTFTLIKNELDNSSLLNNYDKIFVVKNQNGTYLVVSYYDKQLRIWTFKSFRKLINVRCEGTISISQMENLTKVINSVEREINNENK